jgi:hypothetical protein
MCRILLMCPQDHAARKPPVSAAARQLRGAVCHRRQAGLRTAAQAAAPPRRRTPCRRDRRRAHARAALPDLAGRARPAGVRAGVDYPRPNPIPRACR